MSRKQFVKAALKTSNVPKVDNAIPFKESFTLDKLWQKKSVVPHGTFKSFKDLK